MCPTFYFCISFFLLIFLSIFAYLDYIKLYSLFPMYALSLDIFTVLCAFKMINIFKLRTVMFLWCNYYKDIQGRTVVCLV